MRKQFRTHTQQNHRKINQLSTQIKSKIMSKPKNNPENQPQYQRLTFAQIQSITRSMMKDPKSHEQNMGVITSIKGKMYCLKLGEVSSSKDFSHYFYSKQFRRRQEGQPLRRLTSNSLHVSNSIYCGSSQLPSSVYCTNIDPLII